MSTAEAVLSANEAACVTGVPLKQVHRIIDAGLLGDSVKIRKGARVIPKRALHGLKLAYETTGFLTLNGRRQLVRHALNAPEARTIRENIVSFDVCSIKSGVTQGLTSLERARGMITSNKKIMDGTPCFKGTRIPVHDIADMLANGDEVAALLSAYPALSEEEVTAAKIYAEAYPRRGRRRRHPTWRKLSLRTSKTIKFDKLLQKS